MMILFNLNILYCVLYSYFNNRCSNIFNNILLNYVCLISRTPPLLTTSYTLVDFMNMFIEVLQFHCYTTLDRKATCGLDLFGFYYIQIYTCRFRLIVMSHKVKSTRRFNATDVSV